MREGPEGKRERSRQDVNQIRLRMEGIVYNEGRD